MSIVRIRRCEIATPACLVLDRFRLPVANTTMTYETMV
jgi:hypothetical protein